MNRIGHIVQFIRIYWTLIMFDIELHYKGFSRTFQDYKKKYSMVDNSSSNMDTLASHATKITDYFYILDIVCSWYPRKADCIHKTFLGYKFMKEKMKLDVNMVVGVRKFPVEAHAWLMFRDHSLFADEEGTARYKIILSTKD